MPLHDLGDQRETESQTLDTLRGAATHEAAEDPLPLRFRNARTTVRNLDQRDIALPAQGDGHGSWIG